MEWRHVRVHQYNFKNSRSCEPLTIYWFSPYQLSIYHLLLISLHTFSVNTTSFCSSARLIAYLGVACSWMTGTIGYVNRSCENLHAFRHEVYLRDSHVDYIMSEYYYVVTFTMVSNMRSQAVVSMWTIADVVTASGEFYVIYKSTNLHIPYAAVVYTKSRKYINLPSQHYMFQCARCKKVISCSQVICVSYQFDVHHDHTKAFEIAKLRLLLIKVMAVHQTLPIVEILTEPIRRNYSGI